MVIERNYRVHRGPRKPILQTLITERFVLSFFGALVSENFNQPFIEITPHNSHM